jgi:sugar transferase (PEP-CTERM system associated)
MRIRLFGHYWHLGLLILWLSESGVAVASAWLAERLLNGPAVGDTDTWWVHGLVLGSLIMVVMVSMGLYSRRLREKSTGILLRITVSVAAGAFAGSLILAVLLDHRPAFAQVALFCLFAWALLILVRMVAARLIDDDIFKRRVLVFGAGNNAARVAQLRRRTDQRGFKVIGYVPARSEERMVDATRLLDPERGLREICESLEVDEIVVAMDDRREQFPLKDLLEVRLRGIEVTELATFLERETGKVYLDILIPSWMIFGDGFRRDRMRRYSERAFDVAASFALLAFASPLMLLAMIAIKLEEGIRAPLFYGQPRVGYGGSVFRVLKFRSMRVDAEKDGKARWAVANDDRVTRVGKFIRKTRIDEIPQLFNVLGGQMSFVGPRPERPEFVKQLSESIPYYQQRHAVKPGITGWAQLCFPYGASEQDAVEKLQYDLYYVKNHGLLFDILILLQTVEVILLGKGAR